jgi:hypothetical protein
MFPSQKVICKIDLLVYCLHCFTGVQMLCYLLQLLHNNQYYSYNNDSEK